VSVCVCISYMRVGKTANLLLVPDMVE